MTLEIQHTPLDANGALPVTAALDRGVSLDPSLQPAFTGHDRGLENIDRLVGGDALCVTTGQQPGLFTGPLFTLYKAISAVVLARTCTTALKRPVVPVFWVAGDDHDFAEANQFTLLSTSNQLEALALPPRDSGAPSTPLYRNELGSEVEALIARMGELAPDTEFRDEAFGWLNRHYHSGSDMATAFGDALAELLGPMGLVVFHPTHGAAKAAAAPVVLKALENAEGLDRRLQARADELHEAGRPVPVAIQPGNTLVMVDGAMGRDRLMLDGEGFVTRRSREKWSLPALAEMAETAPERLSANVLLRPAVEAALLPTLAYVAGPGEMAYHPQTEPVYEALGTAAQPYVPRWSARVIEPRVRKMLDRHGLTPEDFAAPEGKLETRLVQDAMPLEAATALERLRDTVGEQFTALVQVAKQMDPTLEKPVEHTRNQMTGGLDHVEKRLVSRLKQQNEVLVRQLANARNALFPNGRPQERVFNVFQYLVKYGPNFLQQVEASCETWAAALGSDR
jgi:bacillithiol biosynthesis cysteine-adding enzyme BshC